MTTTERPSVRLRRLRSDLYGFQDRLDGLGFLFVALGCPNAAGAASRAGDAVEDLRHAVEADANRLEERETERDRQVALAAAGGVTTAAVDGGDSQ